MITQILEIVLIPILGILTKYVIDFLTAKSNELENKIENETADKYLKMITDTVVNCVIATNQTYVDSLKKQNAFTEEAQKEAFNRTMNAVLAILSQDAKDYIVEMTGDLKTYLTQLIEVNVNNKKGTLN